MDTSLFKPAPAFTSVDVSNNAHFNGSGSVKSAETSGGIFCYPFENPIFPTPKPTPKPAPKPSRKPWPSRAIMTWKDAINAEEVDKEADIPVTCLDNDYDVELKAMSNDNDGTHFFLTASVSPGENAYGNDNCPRFLAFASRDEKKVTYHVPDVTKVNDRKYSSYLFGKASLKAIVNAESSVEAVKDFEYNLTSNSCIHYAGRIWRQLHFDETNDLATFLIANLLKDDGFLTIAHNKYAAGGLRVLSHLAGKGSLDDFVKETVYSQLNIKDNEKEAVVGKIGYAYLF